MARVTFFLLGTGIIHVEPDENLVDTDDQDDQVAIVGLGIKTYLTRRFLFRAEYKGYIVLDSDNDNEELD